MKNTIFLFLAALFISIGASAQSTADSISAKYQLIPMPEAFTIEKAFPVLGAYQLQNATETSTPVTITLDSVHKGMVWVEGLPQGKFKAYLKQSPATYRIVAQKSESGTSIPAGTLIFDPATSTLNIALGKAFDETNPAAVFANANNASDVAVVEEVKVKKKGSKTKTKITYFTAVKADQNTTAVTAPAAAPAQTDNQQ